MGSETAENLGCDNRKIIVEGWEADRRAVELRFRFDGDSTVLFGELTCLSNSLYLHS